MSLQFEDSLNLSLIARNLSNEHRTLTVVLTLVRINPIDQPRSKSQDSNQTANLNRDIPQNTELNRRSKSSPIPIQSFKQTFHLDQNHRK
jgi:hypothetical protein